ncbi:VWA domain-containing protein, partial [Bacteriovoracaceae bacterium]|nr:VWA domain-containing protein [Bacteriovoracaceae bacterium]
MRFGNPHFLWMLWLIPLIAVFFIWGFRRKQTLIDRFIAPELKERLLACVSFQRQKIKTFLLLLVVFFSILALIRPKWGFHWEEVKRKGVDIIVALDVSGSMLAQDVTPNRLERAKREIIDLLNIVQGDRVGLIAFAGTAFLQAPLTLDYGAVQIFLDDLDTDLIPIPGTAIAEAITKSVASFDQADKKSRVLILITDGEDHYGDPLEEAEKASKQNIKIYTIGIGKKGGAPIPNGPNGGFKKDRRGNLILTQLDEETLQKIALKTKGSYVRSVTGDLDLEQIYDDIRRTIDDKDLKSGRRKRFEERFQWPLIIALLFLILESIFPERKRSRLKSNKNIVSLLLLTFSIFGSLVPRNSTANIFKNKAQESVSQYETGEYDKALQGFIDAQIENPEDDAIKYNLANTYYKMGDFNKARELYETLSDHGDKNMAFKSLYNLGGAAFKDGKLKEAVEYY